MWCSQSHAVYHRTSSIIPFPTDRTGIELPFRSTCLSRRDRDPESWKIDGALKWRYSRWKTQCPVVRQVVLRSDAIILGGVCFALRSECHTQQWVYVKDKQWPLGCNPLADVAEAVCGLLKTNCKLFTCLTPQEDPNWAKSHYLWLAIKTVYNVTSVSLSRSVRC